MCRRLDSDCQYIKRLVKLGACSAPVLKLNVGATTIKWVYVIGLRSNHALRALVPAIYTAIHTKKISTSSQSSSHMPLATVYPPLNTELSGQHKHVRPTIY